MSSERGITPDVCAKSFGTGVKVNTKQVDGPVTSPVADVKNEAP